MPAQTEQARSAILRWTQLGKPLRAAKQYRRHAGQRLRVINDRRSAPEPDYSREGRPDSRNTSLTFERFHQRGFFTYFVGARAAVPVGLEVVAAAENVLPEKSSRVGIFDRFLHDLEQVSVLAANVDVSRMRAGG